MLSIVLLCLSFAELTIAYNAADAMTDACSTARRIASKTNLISLLFGKMKFWTNSEQISSTTALINIGENMGPLVDNSGPWAWRSVKQSLETIDRDVSNGETSTAIALIIDTICFKHEVEINLINMRRAEFQNVLHAIQKGWAEQRDLFRELEQRLVKGDFRFLYSDLLLLDKANTFISLVSSLMENIEIEITDATELSKNHERGASTQLIYGSVAGLLGLLTPVAGPLPFIGQALFYISSAYETGMAVHSRQYIQDLRMMKIEAKNLHMEMQSVHMMVYAMLTISIVLNIVWYLCVPIFLFFILLYTRQRR